MAEARPLTPRQSEQRNRVLEATRRMLARDGYEGLQMRTLAEAADVSLMTIYNRFGNKDDVILLALQDLLSDLAERAQASGERGIENQLRNAEIIAEQILATPEYAKAMALMLFNGQPDSPIVEALLTNNVTQSNERLVEMRTLGEIGDAIDQEALARNLAVCTWSTILMWMKGFIPDDAFAREYRRASLFVLAPAMTPRARKKYAHELS